MFKKALEMERKTYFDCIRGLAVIWVVIVHISLNYGYIKFGQCSEGINAFTLLSFYMVPFYVVSGYFFDVKKHLQSFVSKKVKRLMIPYMTFTFFGLLIFEIYSLLKQGSVSNPNIGSLISTGALASNTPCWFFISLFFVNLIYYFIAKRKNWQRHAIIVACFIFAFLTSGKTQYLGYGNVLLGLVYFHIGTLFKEYEPIVLKKSVFVLAVVIYVSIAVADPQRLSFVLNLQVCGNYILNIFFSVSAMIICWKLALLWKHDGFISRNICFVGRNSLVLFAYHRPVLNYIIQPVLNRYCPDLGYIPFLLIAFTLVIILYGILNWCGKKYFPILLGM